MEKYISLDAVVAEIERLAEVQPTNEFQPKEQNKIDWLSGKMFTINILRVFLDTLEVKEINLEDSVKETLAQKYVDYTFRRHNIDPESKEGQLIYYAYMHGINQCLTQLRTQKGE